MKLDLFKKEWLDVIFEGRNKSYGAYELRTKSTRNSLIALGIGALFFAFAIGAPTLLSNLFDGLGKEEAITPKIIKIKLPPIEKPKENVPPPPPPPPPPPKVDQVKFVKPVVAKADQVVEEPPKVKEIEKVKTGAETIKGDPNAEITIEKPGDGDVKVVEEDAGKLFNSAGVEVKPEFPGGIDKYYSFIQKNFTAPDDESFKGGTVLVQFVVEKDGSLTDIRVLRDLGFGTKAEALRVFNKCPHWTPAEQNGKKVRCTFVQQIKVAAAAQE